MVQTRRRVGVRAARGARSGEGLSGVLGATYGPELQSRFAAPRRFAPPAARAHRPSPSLGSGPGPGRGAARRGERRPDRDCTESRLDDTSPCATRRPSQRSAPRLDSTSPWASGSSAAVPFTQDIPSG